MKRYSRKRLKVLAQDKLLARIPILLAQIKQQMIHTNEEFKSGN